MTYGCHGVALHMSLRSPQKEKKEKINNLTNVKLNFILA